MVVKWAIASVTAATVCGGFASQVLVAPPVAIADPPYANCTEADEDGAYNIPSDDPAYRDELDRDGDGYACEPKPQ